MPKFLDTGMPVSFHFKVNIGGWNKDVDCSFQEVSGLDQKMDIQTIREGGENRFQHQLPNGMKQQPLRLKRGIGGFSSPLVTWCKSVMDGGLSSAVTLHDVQVCLCNENREYVRVWWFYNAFPVQWSVDDFNSTKNSVVIETIELAYQYSKRIK